MTTFLKQLQDLEACQSAIQWVQDTYIQTAAEAWAKCRQPAWMIWWADQKNLWDDSQRRIFACWCVRHTPLLDGRTTWDLLIDERSRHAVEVSEKFARGKVSEAILRAAWAAAEGIASDTANAAAWSVAENAAWATKAATSAARAAASAAARAAAGAVRASWAANWAAEDAAYVDKTAARAAANNAQLSHLREMIQIKD